MGNGYVRHVPPRNAEQIQILPTNGRLPYSFTYSFFIEMDFVARNQILQICSLAAPELRIGSSNTSL